MDFEKIKEQEILDKLRRQGLDNPGETSIQESRNVLNILHENVLSALTLLHQVKDPSAMPRETRLRFVKRLIQFFLRPYTRGQIEFNRITTDILNALKGEMQETSRFLNALKDESQETSRFLEDINAQLFQQKALQEKQAGDMVDFQSAQGDMKQNLATLQGDFSDMKKTLADSFKEMAQAFQEVHKRIEDEKNSYYEALESIRKNLSFKIENEKESLHDHINQTGQSLHKRIEDEMSGSYRVMETLKQDLGYRMDVERKLIHDRLGETVQDLHKRIDDEKKGILDTLPSLGLLESKTQEAKNHADGLVDLIARGLKGLEEKITPSTVFHLCQEHNSVNDDVYFMLEKNFRGTDESIAERQNFYSNLLSGHHANMADKEGFYLDVGSGRGELLQLLRDNKIPASGVDISPEMVEYSRAKGLSVNQAEANEYLKSLPDDHLRGVIALQFIEHLAIRDLFDFITLSSSKLKPGGIIILETINPESVYALRWFYMDYTHNKPLPAPLVQFFFLMARFRDVEIFLRSPVEGWKQMAITGDLEIVDSNFHKLNNFLFGYQDYAIKGIK